MLNLNILRQDVVDTGTEDISGICTDGASGTIYIILSERRVQSRKIRGSEVTWEAFLPEDSGRLINCSFDIELDGLCSCMSNGQILLFDASEGVMEEVGEVDGGLAAASWSPSGELLVLMSGEGKMMVMNKGWDVLQETAIEEDDGVLEGHLLAAITWRGDNQYFAVATNLGGDGHVSVWEQSSLTRHSLLESIPTLTAIEWQPNGRHLYVANHAHDTDTSSISLYEKNGLEHGGFPLRTTGKVSSMAWNMDSQLLAVVIHDSGHQADMDNKIKLQIWRRNNWHWYLKYESWWPDCKSLLVCWDDQSDMVLHVGTSSGLYFATEFVLDTTVSARGTAAVVDGNELKLTAFRQAVIPPPMAMVSIKYSSAIRLISFLDDDGMEGIATVLSSGDLAITLCNNEDCWAELCDNEVTQYAMNQNDENTDASCSYGALTSFSSRSVSDWSLKDRCELFHGLVWYSKSEIAIVSSEPGARMYKITRLTITAMEDGYTVEPLDDVEEVPGVVISSAGATGGPVVLLDDGTVIHHSRNGLSIVAKFLEPCHKLVTFKNMLSGAKPEIFGISRKGHLYCSSGLVSQGVMSAAVRSEGAGGFFLLYTTKSSQLHILSSVRLIDILNNVQSCQPDKPLAGRSAARDAQRSGPTRNMHAAMRPSASVTNESSLEIRQVEQGSRIVSVPSGDTMVVVQLPRGNLETFHPRLLVLWSIADRIDNDNYDQAWELATANRVDLNIVVDYKWPMFLQNVDKFVRSIRREEDFCDLLMGLISTSVLGDNGIYRSANLPSIAEGDSTSDIEAEDQKISAVCGTLRQSILRSDRSHFLRAIVTTHARTDPPDLESALRVIKASREAELSGQPQSVLSDNESGAGAALKHLMLYVNAVKLYEVSLGMYDLEMAYMVVTNAQMDPAEYLVELERFASFTPIEFQMYQVNMHLKRFPEALKCLLEAGDEHFQACLDLAANQGLLPLLLELVDEHDDGDTKRQKVLHASGEWLLKENMLEDAGAAFLAANEVQKAHQAYKAGCHWEMCLSLTRKLGMTAEETRDCAMDLFDQLKSNRLSADAARIALEYLDDVDEAVLLYCEARSWRNAVRTAYRCDREDLVETVIGSAAAECASTSLASFREDCERITKYWDRVKDVRSKREKMEAMIGQTGDTNALDDDGGGEIEGSSTVGGMSVYTENTHAQGTQSTASVSGFTTGGKKPQKKKKKKKGLRIRQGTPEEEKALCEHIQSLCPTNAQSEEVGQLLEVLILLGHDRDARILQKAFDNLVKIQKAAAEDIRNNPPGGWSADALPSSANVPRWKFDILRGSTIAKTNFQ